MELPKIKRPTDKMIYDGSPEEIDEWLDDVLGNKTQREFVLQIDDSEIE